MAHIRIEYIPIAKRLDGSYLALTKVTVGGGEPKLFLGASIHGDELTSLASLWRILEYLKVADIKGTLVLLMGMNPEGIAFGVRYDPYFKVDMNRVYPGDKEGILPWRITNTIYQIAKECDVAVDIHTAGVCIPFILVDPVEGGLRDRVLQYALSMGVTVLEEYEEHQYKAEHLSESLPPKLLDVNIPSFTLELPGGVRIDWKGVNVGYKAIINLMIEMGMLDTSPVSIDEYPVIREEGFRRYDVRTASAGILEPFVELGDFVDKFTPLGVVRNLAGGVEEWVKCDKSGYVIAVSGKSVVYPADRVFFLAIKE